MSVTAGPAAVAHPAPPQLRTVVPPDRGAARVVLVRHGQAACNVEGRVGGRSGCSGLTEHGHDQVRRLGARLADSGELADAAALYASVLPRAVQTAAAIAGAIGGGTLTVVEDCELCELHPGEADGLAWGDFAARYGEPRWDDDPSVPIAPGGESWSGFVARAAGAVAAVAARHRGEQVVVVCHGGVVEATMLAFLGVSGRPRLRLHTRHTSLTEWEQGRSGWRLLRYNDAAHLDAADD